MCIARYGNCLLAISLSVVFTNSALAAIDPTVSAALRAMDAEAVTPAKVMRSESGNRTTLLGGCPSATIGGGCEPIGLFGSIFERNKVYRGNMFEIQEPATVAEFGFELRVDVGVQVCLYFSIHEALQGDRTFFRTPALLLDVQAHVVGNGVATFYTTGTLATPVPLEVGKDYVFGLSWGEPNVRYGFDFSQGPNMFFANFPNAKFLGNTSANLTTVGGPPADPDNSGLLLLPSISGGPWSMEICLAGACCETGVGCTELSERDCLVQEGQFTAPGISCQEIVPCPPVQAACCFDTRSACLETNQFACEFNGGSWFDGEACDDVFDPCLPRGGCCVADGACVDDVTEDRCINGLNSTWRGEGDGCDGDPPCSAGACCDGPDCGPVLLIPELCLQSGGLFGGFGTDCNGSDACDPSGACCFDPDPSDAFLSPDCTDGVTAAACTVAGGIYRGDWTTCATTNCKERGACCRPGLGCQDLNSLGFEESQCVSAPVLGTYQGDGTDCDTLDPRCKGNCCETGGCGADVDIGFCGLLQGVFVGHDETCETDCGTIAPGDAEACCLPDGSCVDTLAGLCDSALSGFPLGLSTRCLIDGATCPLPPDTVACCLGDGSCGDLSEADCTTGGGMSLGVGTTCTAGFCTLGACCSGGDVCVLTDAASCTGVYLPGEPCSASTCAGACCLADESCEASTETDCIADSGRYQGDGATCDAGDCAPVTCCLPDGSCDETLVEFECDRDGGNSTLVACGPEVCPPGGTCCMPDELCRTLTVTACSDAGGVHNATDQPCETDVCTQGACCVLSGTCEDGLVGFQCTSSGAEFNSGLMCDDVSLTCDPRGACCQDGICTIETDVDCEALPGEFQGVGVACSPDLCGCKDGTIVFTDPALDINDEWLDSRQPYADGNPAVLQGRTTFTFDGPDNAEVGDGACWTICETTLNADLHPTIGPAAPGFTIVNNGGNNYTITLDRPITHGEVTTLTYDNTGSGSGTTMFTATFRYLPGDVDGSGASTPDDILALIASLNDAAPLSLDQVDTDRSGEVDAVDILGVINLLNGGGDHDVWLDATIPPGQGCVP